MKTGVAYSYASKKVGDVIRVEGEGEVGGEEDDEEGEEGEDDEGEEGDQDWVVAPVPIREFVDEDDDGDGIHVGEVAVHDCPSWITLAHRVHEVWQMVTGGQDNAEVDPSSCWPGCVVSYWDEEHELIWIHLTNFVEVRDGLNLIKLVPDHQGGEEEQEEGDEDDDDNDNDNDGNYDNEDDSDDDDNDDNEDDDHDDERVMKRRRVM